MVVIQPVLFLLIAQMMLEQLLALAIAQRRLLDARGFLGYLLEQLLVEIQMTPGVILFVKSKNLNIAVQSLQLYFKSKFMKKIICIALLILLYSQPFYAQHNKGKYQKAIINCYIKNSGGKKVMIGNKPKGGINEAYKVIYFDSGYSKNDSISFQVRIAETIMMSIEIDGKNSWVPFIISPGEVITFKSDYDTFFKGKTSGSKEDSLFVELMSMYQPVKNEIKAKGAMSADTLNLYMDKLDSVGYRFLAEYTNSFVSALVIYDLSIKEKNDPEILKRNQRAYNSLSNKIKETSYAQKAYKTLFVLPYSFKKGTKFPHVKMQDYLSGKKIDVNKLIAKNKFLLVDFWATWCVPCIKEFDIYKSYYNDFHSKGFEMISISYDINETKYKDFFNHNNIPWITTTDFQGEKSPVDKIFGIKLFPSNFLIDNKGEIQLVNASANEIKLFLDKNINEH